MRNWNYAINSMYRTGSIEVSEAPFWVYWLESIFDWICSMIPYIPLPPIGRVVDEEVTYNWKEWFGDTQQLFEIVHMRIQEWLWRKQNCQWFDVPYEKLRDAFYDKDKAWWDENEDRAKEDK